MKKLIFSALASVAMALSGCQIVDLTGSCPGYDLPPYNPDACVSDMDIELDAELSAASLATFFVPSDIELDFTGSTVGLAENGGVTVTLRNAQGGVVGASTFTWSRSGMIATIDNPTSVSQWIGAQSGNVKSIEVTVPIAISTQSGINAFMSTGRYDGQVMAAGGQVWTQGPPCENLPYTCIE